MGINAAIFICDIKSVMLIVIIVTARKLPESGTDA